jgi:hypothetical protein
MLWAVAPDREAWLAERAKGVCASEVHRIANGGRSTWRRILEDKLNGSTFKGNRHTRRGHRREPVLLGVLKDTVSRTIEPNDRLFSHPEHSRHMATPDAMGSDDRRFGVEVKSHAAGWARTDVPPDHYDQCQWGMWVTESPRWLYAWEVMDEDGLPSLDDPAHVWIDRDEKRIAELAAAAEAFLAWWDAGAPEDDGLPDELDEALAAWVEARARKQAAEADEKAAEAVVRAHIAGVPGAEDKGLKLAGWRAQVAYTVSTRRVLDEAAWRAAEPDGWREWAEAAEAAERARKDAELLYGRAARQTRLRITPREVGK